MTRFSTLILSAALMLGACGESQNSAKTQSGDPAAKTAETPSAAQTQAQTSAQAQAQEPTKTKETAKAETSDETQTAKISQAEPMVLSWEDLMPVGEEALLAEMYTNYYEDLESKMLASSKSLSEASENPDAFDINSITEGAANDTMDQIGTFNVVSSLNGLKVRIPGYVVPLDFSAKSEHTEFLLVPYFGACLHTPPPPPNQIVFVKANPAADVENIYEPFWLEGTLKTGEFNSDLANTAYELVLNKIEPYDY